VKDFVLTLIFMVFCGASACFASGALIEGIYKNSQGWKLLLIGMLAYIVAFILLMGWIVSVIVWGP